MQRSGPLSSVNKRTANSTSLSDDIIAILIMEHPFIVQQSNMFLNMNNFGRNTNSI
jgi:hypothetical protein